jgi:hypothetical protein
VELVAVLAGELALTVEEGEVLLRTAVEETRTMRVAERVGAGSGLVVRPGAVVGYRNAGNDSVVLLVATITGEEATDPGVSGESAAEMVTLATVRRFPCGYRRRGDYPARCLN